MLWSYQWPILRTTQMIQILKTRSLRHISSSPPWLFTVSDRTSDLFSQENRKFTLTAHVVHSTLLNCPSDLIALSFFVWCAKRHNYFHDSFAFDHMIPVVSRLTDRYNTVRGIIKALENVGSVIKAHTFLLLLRIYWRGAMYAMVFEVYEQMSRFGFEPNTFARNVLMDVLYKLGCVDAGITVLRETQSPNFLSFNISLCNLCRLNHVDGVTDVLRMMLRMGYYPNVETFEMALNCFCKVGKLVETYQILGIMTTLGISVSVNAWTILVDGFCRLKQPVLASHLLEKMVQSGCSPTVVTYTTLFKGYIESRMVNKAFGVLNTLASKGFVPDLLLVNVIIHGLSKIGRYDDALNVFLGLSKWNLVPDSYTFSSLFSAICSSRRFSLLPKLVSGIVIEADTVVYNTLLNYYCKIGFPDLALNLYNDMVDKGFAPDNYSFVALVRALCGIRRVNEAINVYHGIIMSNPGHDAFVHTVIIDELMRGGQCCKAMKILRKAIVEKYPLDNVSYTIVIRGLLKVGRTAEASSLYYQMKDVGLSPDACTYSLLICGFGKERDMEMVQKLIEEIIELGVQLDCKVLIKLTNSLLKSHLSSSLYKYLIKLWNLSLLNDEKTRALFFAGHEGRKIFEAYPSSKTYVKDNQLLDASSSDDQYDVAVSMG